MLAGQPVLDFPPADPPNGCFDVVVVLLLLLLLVVVVVVVVVVVL